MNEKLRWGGKEDGWHSCNDNDEEMGFVLIINEKEVRRLEGTIIEDDEYNGQYKLWDNDEIERKSE